MNNKIYYKKAKNGQLEKVQHKVIKINNRPITNPTDKQLASIEVYQRRSTQPPKCEEGYHFETNGWKVVDNMWEQQWKIVKNEDPVYTVEDYDRALEQHLKDTCSARGYTTREPSDYVNSSVERWAQDAKDYIAFRDQVMQYGLEIMNKFQNNEEVPNLQEFKDNLPQIIWTFE